MSNKISVRPTVDSEGKRVDWISMNGVQIGVITTFSGKYFSMVVGPALKRIDGDGCSYADTWEEALEDIYLANTETSETTESEVAA